MDLEPLSITVTTPPAVNTPFSPQCLLSPSGACTQSDLDTDACVELALRDDVHAPSTPDIGCLLSANRRPVNSATPTQPAIPEITPINQAEPETTVAELSPTETASVVAKSTRPELLEDQYVVLEPVTTPVIDVETTPTLEVITSLDSNPVMQIDTESAVDVETSFRDTPTTEPTLYSVTTPTVDSDDDFAFEMQVEVTTDHLAGGAEEYLNLDLGEVVEVVVDGEEEVTFTATSEIANEVTMETGSEVREQRVISVVSEDEPSESSVVEREVRPSHDLSHSPSHAPSHAPSHNVSYTYSKDDVTLHSDRYFHYDPITYEYRPAEHWYDRFISPVGAKEHYLGAIPTLVDTLYCTRMLIAAGFVVLSSRLDAGDRMTITTRRANTPMAGIAGVVAGVVAAPTTSLDLQRLVAALRARFASSSSSVGRGRGGVTTAEYSAPPYAPVTGTAYRVPEPVPGTQRTPRPKYRMGGSSPPTLRGDRFRPTASPAKTATPEVNLPGPGYPFATPNPSLGHLKYIGSRY